MFSLQVLARRPALPISLCQNLAPGPQEPWADKHQDKTPDFHRNFIALVSSVNYSGNVTTAGQQAVLSLKSTSQGAGYGCTSSKTAMLEPPWFVSRSDLPNSPSLTVFFPQSFSSGLYFCPGCCDWPLWNKFTVVIGDSPESSRLSWHFTYCLLTGNFFIFFLFWINFPQGILAPCCYCSSSWKRSSSLGGVAISEVEFKPQVGFLDLPGAVAALSHETSLKSFCKEK